MAADLNIKRNGGYVVRAVLSGILLLLAAAGLIFLLTRLIPGRILLWIAGGMPRPRYAAGCAAGPETERFLLLEMTMYV